MLYGLTREASAASLYLLHLWKEVTLYSPSVGVGVVLPEVLTVSQMGPLLTPLVKGGGGS